VSRSTLFAGLRARSRAADLAPAAAGSPPSWRPTSGAMSPPDPERQSSPGHWDPLAGVDGRAVGRRVDPAGRSDGRAAATSAVRVPVGPAVGVAVVLGVVGVGVGPIVTIGLVLCLVWWWRRRSAGGEAVRQGQLPEALERMAGALRTGSSVPQALAEAARAVDPPLGLELADMAAATLRGRPLAEVVDEWALPRRDRGTRLVATALVLATAVGAAPARALDGVAATMRERLELAGERRALATQARASAVVLSVAPVGFALLLCASDPAVAGFLLGTTAGWLCLMVGVGLDAVGAFWMTRLTKAVVR